jgi:hypothetical protein
MKKTVWKAMAAITAPVVLAALFALAAVLIACSNPSGGDPLESGGGSGGGGASVIDTEDFGGAAVTRTFTVTTRDEWESALSAISGGGDNRNYVITVGGPVNGITGLVPGNFGAVTGVKVSLRGTGTLTLNTDSNNGSLVAVAPGQTLILRGPTLTGKTGNTASVVTVGINAGLNAAFMMRSGTISGNVTTSYGGGVLVRTTGSFTMTGGEISDNSSQFGGGVFAYGNFTMSGGKISKNSSSNFGGGVYVYDGSSFTMKGGEISGNSADWHGGGVYASGNSFILENGGKISNNTTVYHGGGVYLYSGSFTMKGGEISGNSAGQLGAGILAGSAGSFTMEAGVISGNITDWYGGGVFTYSTFVKTGGAITGNDAHPHGHAAYYSKDDSNKYYRDADLNDGDDISTGGELPGSLGETLNNWTKYSSTG